MLKRKHLLAAVTLALFALWFLLLRPTSLGGPAIYVIVHGRSMEPTMHTGDLALAIRQSSYQVGDVLAFRVEEGRAGRFRVPEGGGIVIHRVIGGNGQDGYRMQGDNNDWVDSWKPTQDQVQGKALVFIPRLGSVFSFLQNPQRMAIAVGVFFGYISLAGFILSYKGNGSRERRRLRREKALQRRAGPAGWLLG